MEKKISEARIRLDQKKLDALMKEDKAAADAMQERMERIESGSKKLAKLFTESSLKSIDTFVDVSQKVVNYLIDQANEATGNREMEPINIREKMEQLKQSIEGDQETDTPIALEFVELTKVMYTEGFQKIKKQLDSAYEKQEEEFAAAEGMYLDFEAEELQFQSFLDKTPRENLGHNNLDYWNAFYDDAKKQAAEMLDAQMNLAESGKAIADARTKQAVTAEDECHKEFERLEKEGQDLKGQAFDAKAASIRAFCDTVLNSPDQPQKPVSLSRSDIFADNEAEFALLGKLTGTEISRDMDIDKAMMAFGSIYINGLNSVTWFGLHERWNKASLEAPDSPGMQTVRKELFDELARCETCLRESLKVPFDPGLRQGLDEGARRLEGQMIAVENSRLGLSPLELCPDPQERPHIKPEKLVFKEHEKGLFKGSRNSQIDKENQRLKETYDSSMEKYRESITSYRQNYGGLDSYNKNSHMTASTFSEMRVKAAETEMNKPRLKSSYEKLDRDQKLAYAVQKSRSLYSSPKQPQAAPKKQQISM